MKKCLNLYRIFAINDAICIEIMVNSTFLLTVCIEMKHLSY